MNSIDHLSKEEQKHFFQCDCGCYVDMRDLAQVFRHFHADLPEPQWSYAVKVGEAKAYRKDNTSIDLN